MRVGVFVDAFNLYYGCLSQLGDAPGWKWMDIRTLAKRYATWPGAHVTRVVYCTARVNDPSNPAQTLRQGFYLQALALHGSVDLIEEGYYSSWAKERAMTVESAGTKAPTALRDTQRTLQWTTGMRLRRTQTGDVLATVRHREEKGSDVNVATHLLSEVLQQQVDAAIVVSNDSDLALPIAIARDHVPVGLINPNIKPLAGALKGKASDGVGQHWWRRLDPADVQACQMPDDVQGVIKPANW